jgi:F420H(2)-dependent quinone reductase
VVFSWARHPSFVHFGKTVMRPLDLVTRRLGVAFSSVGTGAPTVFLSTTGRQTGKLRINPVLAIDVPFGVGLISSNWGQNFRPGWHYNLLAEPRCTLQRGRRRTEYVARRPTEPERTQIWHRALEIYPPWQRYADRVDRELDVFVLEPAR